MFSIFLILSTLSVMFCLNHCVTYLLCQHWLLNIHSRKVAYLKNITLKGKSDPYLNVIKMAIVGLVQLVLWKLEVNHPVLLHRDGPDAVDWGVVRQTVVDAIHADVGRPNEVLKNGIRSRFTSMKNTLPDRTFLKLKVTKLEDYRILYTKKSIRSKIFFDQ